MKLTEILIEDMIIPNLKGGGKEEVLDEMAKALREKRLVTEDDHVLEALMERERLGSTGIGFNVAIPHAKMKDIKNMVAVLGRSKKGVEFDSLDKKPVHLVWVLIAPQNLIGIHLKALAKISRLLKDEDLRKDLMGAAGAAEMYGIIRSRDEQ